VHSPLLSSLFLVLFSPPFSSSVCAAELCIARVYVCTGYICRGGAGWCARTRGLAGSRPEGEWGSLGSLRPRGNHHGACESTVPFSLHHDLTSPHLTPISSLLTLTPISSSFLNSCTRCVVRRPQRRRVSHAQTRL
jgi:hypothetical protein